MLGFFFFKRFAKYYRENGRDLRTLYKVFGIRFDILVNGKVTLVDLRLLFLSMLLEFS